MLYLLLGAAGFLMCLLSFIAGTRYPARYNGSLPRGKPLEENQKIADEFNEACASLIGYSVEKAYERQTR